MRTQNNTSGKKHNTNNTNRKTYNYRPIHIGNRRFESSSKAAIFLLQNSSLNQSEISRICKVSQPCVCQLARELKIQEETTHKEIDTFIKSMKRKKGIIRLSR